MGRLRCAGSPSLTTTGHDCRPQRLCLLGTSREDGKTKGEYAPIFYKKNRIKCLKNGQFWLSETPDSVGSVGWDASMERICTWGYFEDKTTKWNFWFFNLHMDHLGTVARAESSRFIRLLRTNETFFL